MRSVTVVTDPADYARVIGSMKANGGDTTPDLRLELGRKVYARTARYDAAIAAWLTAQAGETAAPPPFIRAWTDGVKLRYGENPHQSAVFYRDASATEAGIAQTDQLHGKEMSYNNYLDGDAALEAVRELTGRPAVAIVKHNNPCGYATGTTLAAAFEAAWAGDPVSAFGSVIAVTEAVDRAVAERLKGRFVEALIAPDFTPDALEFLRSKSKDLRLLRLRHPMTAPRAAPQFRQIGGGVLVQDRDLGANAHWTGMSETPFPEHLRPLAEFGVRVCKYVKSNAIVLVREYEPGQFHLLGMGAGQPNRVDSVRKLALARAQENIARMYEAAGGRGETPEAFRRDVLAQTVLVGDAFFPFADNIDFAAQAGVRYIVEPGGSVRDDEVIAACNRYGIALAFTGMRHFRH
jgi:phosphoribosylaminoimidazolecarboxamide formyltransferase/IMP cyclohydrolase